MPRGDLAAFLLFTQHRAVFYVLAIDEIARAHAPSAFRLQFCNAQEG